MISIFSFSSRSSRSCDFKGTSFFVISFQLLQLLYPKCNNKLVMAQEGTLYKKDSFEFLRIYLYIAVMGYRFEPRSLTFKASKRMYGINSYILYFAFNTIPHYCKYKIRRNSTESYIRYTTLDLEKFGRKIHLRSYDFISEVLYTKNVIKNEPI